MEGERGGGGELKPKRELPGLCPHLDLQVEVDLVGEQLVVVDARELQVLADVVDGALLALVLHPALVVPAEELRVLLLLEGGTGRGGGGRRRE